jgi:hypothetical protein
MNAGPQYPLFFFLVPQVYAIANKILQQPTERETAEDAVSEILTSTLSESS